MAFEQAAVLTRVKLLQLQAGKGLSLNGEAVVPAGCVVIRVSRLGAAAWPAAKAHKPARSLRRGKRRAVKTICPRPIALFAGGGLPAAAGCASVLSRWYEHRSKSLNSTMHLLTSFDSPRGLRTGFNYIKITL